MQDEIISIRISRAEAEALRERAQREGISEASLVRRALRAYGATPEPESGKSGYDVIKHLIGESEGGPNDLSSNPEHLDGYGR